MPLRGSMRTYSCGETPFDPGGGDVTPYGPASYLKRFSAAQAFVMSFIVSVMAYTSQGWFLRFQKGKCRDVDHLLGRPPLLARRGSLLGRFGREEVHEIARRSRIKQGEARCDRLHGVDRAVAAERDVAGGADEPVLRARRNDGWYRSAVDRRWRAALAERSRRGRFPAEVVDRDVDRRRHGTSPPNALTMIHGSFGVLPVPQ